MKLFNRSKTSSDVCLILDIGNASIAGSLVLFEKGNVPQSLYTIRIPLSISEHPHPEKLESLLESELEEILSIIHTKGFEHAYFANHEKKVARVLSVYASPWYVSKTKKVTIQNEKPFFVTAAFLDNVLAKEVESFEGELSSGLHGEEFTSGIVVMERTLIDVKINGYSVENAIGQKTTECDITTYLGIGSTKVVNMVNTKILRFFQNEVHEILSHSFPLVAHTAIQTMFPHEKDYLLFDITGEVTDITHIQGGVVGNTVSFPSGKFFVVRKIMRALNVPAEVAKSFLHLWQLNSAHPDIEQKIQSTLTDVEYEWSIYLEDAISSLGDVRSLPQKIYMTADQDVGSIFKDFFSVSKTDMTAVWRKGLSVIYLTEEALSHFYNSPNHLMFDDCVALDSIFLSRFQ